jgi:cell division protein FtsB
MGLAASGLLALSSTRRAAVLALVVCALALTVAVPLRNFLSQRQELAALYDRQRQLSAEVAELTRRRDELRDTAHLQAEARERLGYVRPGEIPFVVQLPGDAGVTPTAPDGAANASWLQTLWNDLRGVPR